MPAILGNHHPNVSIDINTLTSEELRYQICIFLSQRLKNGKLGKNSLDQAAEMFGRKKGGVQHLWRTHKKAIVNPEKFKLNIKRKEGTGGKRKIKVSDVVRRVKAVPFWYRQTYRSLAAQVGIPTTTIFQLLKSGILKRSISAVKPALTDANKVQRVAYCESFIEPDGCFGDMLDRVDIDEKR